MKNNGNIERREFIRLSLAAAAMAALPLGKPKVTQGAVERDNYSGQLHAPIPENSILASGWQMRGAMNVAQSGGELSTISFSPQAWYTATVPGTVLTTLVNNGVYPEPLYGQNNRPDKIPETLCRMDWWYRGVFPVPASYAGSKTWLNFEGINYTAEVWVNGKNVGAIEGAFIRGHFDITSLVKPGHNAAIAVRVSPDPHPGIPCEHTLGAGSFNGGVTALDGPTFICTLGWDWIPGIRDRDTGIWQKVFLSTTGPVRIKNPQVTTDLPLPRTDSAKVTISAAVQNVTGYKQKGVLKGSFAGISFEKPVYLSYGETRIITFDPQSFPQLHVKNPRLWWPNGFGPQNLYTLQLSFAINGTISDAQDISFGIRKITYDVPGTDSLALSVNGVRVFCKGGCWGMDEAMKRIPRARLEAQIRMHQIANLTMIRNWGGQSTSEDFYELCDKYGLLVWDEFFQFNDWNPLNFDRLMNNSRDKVLRIRNHPSIAVWCARNESTPPKYLDDALRELLNDLDPDRWYQSNSGGGRGVNSGGPYDWQTPENYYRFSELRNFNKRETFKTEIGAISIPTLESIQGMMPEEDWNSINDDWAEHDFNSGSGHKYPQIMAHRYGKITNLADFVRKGQMMNYEGYRAMYEGRLGQLFLPVQGILTWMSNPAQPSFVWQLYHYDLEPNASFFAVKKACEQVHIQLNDIDNGTVQVINHLSRVLTGASARIIIYNFDGTSAYQHEYGVTAAPGTATNLGTVAWPAALSHVHFVKLELRDAGGKLLSDNFYWHAASNKPDDLTSLNTLPVAILEAKAVRYDADGKIRLSVTLRNPGPQVALLTHLQLYRGTSKQRVLPVYYTDNYVSLAPEEEKTIVIEAAVSDLNGEKPLILIDGWNIAVKSVLSSGVDIALNSNAQINSAPASGLPFRFAKLKPGQEVRVNCGGYTWDGFQADPGQLNTVPAYTPAQIDANVPLAAPMYIYKSVCWGESSYACPLLNPPPGKTYIVRLHFAELDSNTGTGRRVFNVNINGNRVLTDLDIFKESGGFQKALVKQITGITPDAKGIVTISALKGKSGTPQINGIEVM